MASCRWDWFGQRAFLVRGSYGTVVASGGGAVPPLTPEQAIEFANFASGFSWVAAAEPAMLLQNTTVRYTALTSAGVQSTLGE